VSAIEHEVKLEVDAGFVMPDLGGGDASLVMTEMADLHLDALYYDVADARLLDGGVTVRRRSGEGTRWTVKLPAAGPGTARSVSRREVEFLTDDEDLPGEVVELVAPFAAGGELVAVARLRSHRRRWRISSKAGTAIAEVDDDTVIAEAPGGEAPPVSFREVEVEFDAAAPPAQIEAMVAVLVGAGARAGDPRTKVERSLSLLGRRR